MVLLQSAANRSARSARLFMGSPRSSTTLTDGLLFVQKFGRLVRLSRSIHVNHLAEGLEDWRRSRYAPQECNRFDVVPAFG